MLDPYFTATKITYLLRHGDLALPADSPDLAFGTVDSWLLWNLTGGTEGGEFATDPSNASRTMLLDTSTLAWSDDLCALFGVPPHTLPEVRPSAGRFGRARLPDLGPAGAVLDGVPVAGVLGDQQAALFGQACFDPGMVKVTYGTGSFVLANAGPERPAAPDGLTVSVAWDLGPYAAPGPQGSGAVRRWPTPSRGPPSSRAPPSNGCATASASSATRPRPAPWPSRSATAAASPSCPPSPGWAARGGTRRPGAPSPASPGAPAGPRSPGPASRPWPSRCAT